MDQTTSAPEYPQAPSPDLEMARAFTQALTGSADTALTFHLNPEKPDGARHREWSHMWRLTPDIGEYIVEQNLRGMGVFTTINETAGDRRRREDIVRLRALAVDDDKGLLPIGCAALVLRPTITVQTRRGFHHWWLLKDSERDKLDSFTRAQLLLASCLGTDPAVSDLARVLRVPGFLHMKKEPLLVRLVRAGDERYTLAELEAAYPATASMPRERQPATSSMQGGHFADQPKYRPLSPRDGRRVLKAMMAQPLILWAREQAEDVRYPAWRGIATNIAAVVLDIPELHDLGLRLFEWISEADERRYSSARCEKAWLEALKSARSHGPMTYPALEEGGAPRDLFEEEATCPAHAARRATFHRVGGGR